MFKKSLICVYVKVKHFLDNKKGKFYYKIEPLISASRLNNKKKIQTGKIKTCILTHSTNSYKLFDILHMSSKQFFDVQYYFELKILSINSNIYYDYSKSKYDFDCDQQLLNKKMNH